jgi:hypothetical protein
MKQEAAPRPRSETDTSFAQIIEKEYGADATRQVIGEAAVRQTLPFGDQFMSNLPEIPTDPKATTPGGLTSTTNNGVASLDDSSSNDVA